MSESEEGYFDKNVFVHERDNDGKLLSVDISVKIKGKEGKIKVIPMTKGQIDTMRNDALSYKELMKKNKEEATKKQVQQDKDLIINHIMSPKFDDKDFEFFKPKEYIELVKAIMIASGFEKEEMDIMFKSLVKQAEKELGGTVSPS